MRVEAWNMPMRNEKIIQIEEKHNDRDPKDGEVYLERMKSEETLMEVRTNTDVQIVWWSWV